MNFNLISPKDNGHTYNVRFNESIVVPENASVHLNWATFERQNKMKFSKAQTAKIIVKEVLPYFDHFNDGDGELADNTWRINGSDRGTDLTFTLAAGNYTLAEIQDFLSNAVYSMSGQVSEDRANVGQSDVFRVPINNSLRCFDYTAVVPRDQPKTNYLEWGMMNNYSVLPFAIHPVHKVNMTKSTTAGFENFLVPAQTGAAFTVPDAQQPEEKIPANGSYVNYALGSHRYIHAGGNFDSYSGDSSGRLIASGDFDELEYVNTIQCTLDKDYKENDGNIFLGLYAEGAAGVDIGGATYRFTIPNATQPVADRTHLGNLVDLEDAGGTGFHPMCYFGVELTGKAAGNDNNGCLNIYAVDESARNDQADSLTTLHNLISFISLDDIRNPRNTRPVVFGIQTYFDYGNTNNGIHGAAKGDLHCRVFVGDTSGNKQIVYDTNSKNPHNNFQSSAADPLCFTGNFIKQFRDENTRQNGNLAEAMASIPFSPLVATTHPDHVYVEYTQQLQSVQVGGVAKTNSSLVEYEFEFSEELGNLVADESTSQLLGKKAASLISLEGAIQSMNRVEHYTNYSMEENIYFYRLNQIAAQYVKDKLSIYLPDLPIKSFKNNDDKSKSGFRKPILANIPSPFSESPLFLDGGAKVIGGYAASIGVVNRLSNQQFTTNNFTVEIRDLETDQPADLIENSIINFTISSD